MAEHKPLPAFSAYSGSRQPKLLIVGEALWKDEFDLKRPFLGEAGKELFLMLGEAMPKLEPELHLEVQSLMRYGQAWLKKRDLWLEAAKIGMTNVLNLRPPENKVASLCGTKAEVGGKYYELPAIAHGKYLRPEFLNELDRLYSEINQLRPNLILAMGNTACWALLRATNIGQIRGAITQSPAEITNLEQVKVLPSYHPVGIMYQWAWRPIVVMDLIKAEVEMRFGEIRRPKRNCIVSPTLEEINLWVKETIQLSPRYLACDIETRYGQTRCVGFARSRNEALVIPFTDEAKPGWNYWPTLEHELAAWRACELLLESEISKLFQNGMYDLQYLTRIGLKIKNCSEDTMLLHHSLFPEMLKGLGFLGSCYTNEPSWKLMRRQRPDTEKKDE